MFMTQNRLTSISISIVAAAAAIMVVCRYLDMNLATTISKMIASSAFVAVGISVGALKTRYGRIVLAALLLSWVGDLLLTGESEKMFLFGLGSFLLAHVAYIAAFLARGIDRKTTLIAFIPIALISLSTAVWLTPYVPADFVIPVRVYSVVISLMVVAAFGSKGAGAPWFVPIGALLFYFSDLSVATGQFMQTEFPNYLWGLPFYFAGQVLLALSARGARYSA